MRIFLTKDSYKEDIEDFLLDLFEMNKLKKNKIINLYVYLEDSSMYALRAIRGQLFAETEDGFSPYKFVTLKDQIYGYEFIFDEFTFNNNIFKINEKENMLYKFKKMIEAMDNIRENFEEITNEYKKLNRDPVWS